MSHVWGATLNFSDPKSWNFCTFAFCAGNWIFLIQKLKLLYIYFLWRKLNFSDPKNVNFSSFTSCKDNNDTSGTSRAHMGLLGSLGNIFAKRTNKYIFFICRVYLFCWSFGVEAHIQLLHAFHLIKSEWFPYRYPHITLIEKFNLTLASFNWESIQIKCMPWANLSDLCNISQNS